MYSHPLPTTGAISFSDFLITSDLIQQISHATELRARLRTVLKEQRAGDNHQPDGGGADWLRIVKAVDDYLPYLFAVFNCIQTDDLILRYEPQFSWRTTLSSSFLRSPPRIALPGIYYELCSTLLLSGVVLCNFAAATAAALGDYERDRRLSDAERKAKDDKLRWAADTLCRACGVFEHLSQVLIPQWEARVGRIDGRPPDLTREVTSALAKLALAEAQTLAIRKLVSPSIAHATDTITPGPPLPKSHPSPSLLAKLHLDAAAHFESARSLAKTVGKRTTASSKSSDFGHHAYVPPAASPHDLTDGLDPGSRGGGGSGGKRAVFGKLKSLASRDASGASSGKGGGAASAIAAASLGIDTASDADLEIDAPLLRYLETSAGLHRALAYKWLGIDTGESGGRVGEAIAFLRMARDGLEDGFGGSALRLAALRDRGAAAKEARDEMRALRKEELRTVGHWLTSYGKLNDTVSFQPIPRASELQSRIPAGRAALESKPYRLPMPAFGPGSSGQGGYAPPNGIGVGAERSGRAGGAGGGGSGASETTRCGADAIIPSSGLVGQDGVQRETDPDRLAFGGLSIGRARDESEDYAGAGAYY
ncbi:hypothetical protein ACQY0O_004950 [Thecaphora frezii]